MNSNPLSAHGTLRTEGALLPADVLARIASNDAALGGLDPASYHLDSSETIGEATNRAWNRLQARWATFQTERAKLAPTDTGTSVTRERWLLPLFEELKFGRLQLAAKVEIDGKSYAVSHAWQHVPIHLVGCQLDLDKRILVAGTHRSSPHSLLQELLNRSAGHLWGIVSNGLRLRLLRDNISLTRQAYVEFDLEAMMAGEAYPDFVLLWLILHQSQFEGERAELCQLEKWSQAARTEGVRVLEGLRDGVQKAIEYLGQGFLAHPANTALREKLRAGALDKQDYYRQLLRLVYRLLFLFVGEDRDLLVVPDADPAAQKRYRDHYATTRLRRLATTRAGSRHHDFYCGLKLVMDKLSGDGCPELALPALGSFLFSPKALPDLNACDITNLHLLEAIRSLAVTHTGQSRRVVDYKNLGAEELGSVYESLLELHPDLNGEAATFELKVAAGSERKKTGSYYTPTNLISCLLDSALNPVLDEAAKQADPEAAILKLKAVDPACGSGHFLIAAAHRIAKRLAAVRTVEEEPAPEAQRKALRDVIGHCIYGVDVNPMAVELCKVSLWMEALEPGKPLSFLEHRIQCGNSLLGATPALLAEGIPDEAFTPIEGDDKEICKEFKRINRDERNKQMRLFAATTEPWQQLGNFASSLMNVDTVGDDSIEAIREKERMYEEAIRSGDYLDGRFWADTWCAAFVWKKTREFGYPITEEVFRRIERNPHACEPWMRREIERLAAEYRFFHWHLAFPDVVKVALARERAENAETGWNGGFDVVLGNPPWDQVQFREQEFFGAFQPDIAQASTGSERKRLIEELGNANPRLFDQYVNGRRQVDGFRMFVQASSQYPLTGHGRINVFALFVEHNIGILNLSGRVGCVVPSGIASDDSTKRLFQRIIEDHLLCSLFDFENRRGLFPEVDSRMKFSLLSLAGNLAGRASDTRAEFAFFLEDPNQLMEPDRVFAISSDEIALLNPNTKTCPIFRSRRDADLLIHIYRRFPVLLREQRRDGNVWSVITKPGLFNMSGDSNLFKGATELESDGWHLAGNVFRKGDDAYLPLYEGKMAALFDHRAADVVISETAVLRQGQPEELTEADHRCATRLPRPRHWVHSIEVQNRLAGQWARSWILGWKEVTAPTNERTLIPGIFPRVGIGHKIPIALPQLPLDSKTHLLFANLSSMCLDFVVRNKLGTTSLTPFTVKQIPIIPPEAYSSRANWVGPSGLEQWIGNRLLELLFTAEDLSGFAADLGYSGPPFQWDVERRPGLRCELDALYFRLYGLSRDDTAYVLDTFPIVRRKDEAAYGEYRTKRVVLEIYDAMAEAERTGVPYQTRLDPPPADRRCCHPPRPASQEVLA